MPELRKDPVIGRWVIIASERARRPGNFIDRNDPDQEGDKSECSFCSNSRQIIMPGSPEKNIAVVASESSSFKQQNDFQRRRQGLYDVIDGVGNNEIVVETPDHVANMADLDVHQIRLVFETYAQRIRDFEKDPQYQYALVYKNYGPTAGSRNIKHTRSHIVATPVRPLRVKEKLAGAQQYFEAHARCVYCDLIAHELKSRERVVYETEHFIAVVPFAARFLFEICVLPKKHHCDFHQGSQGQEVDLAAMMKALLLKLQKGLDDPAYNFVVQTAPFRRPRPDAKKWATVEKDYHWHIELMPRLTRVAGFEKGTGFYICSIPPENMAEFLQGVEV